MKIWFNTKIKYQKQTDQGLLKTVTESYLVDAVNYTEAEAQITEIMSAEIDTGFIVTGISKTNIEEVILPAREQSIEIWYKAKVSFIGIDDSSQAEKKITRYVLINSISLAEAINSLDDDWKNMLVPYEIESVVKTNIIEVHDFKG